MSERQIFIAGTGRTGSTVLRNILGEHSKIFSYLKELRFLTDSDGLFNLIDYLTDQWNPFNTSLAIHRFRSLLLDELWAENLYERAKSEVFARTVGGTPRRYTGIDLSEIIPRSFCRETLDDFLGELATARPGSWYGSPPYQRHPTMYVTKPRSREELYSKAGEFVDTLLSYPLEEGRDKCWCDDTPINIMNAEGIIRMFEEPRLIHLYRDPRDVVASYMDERQTWAPNDPETAATWVLEIMRKWWEQRDRIPDLSFREVKYEELARKQRVHMQKIADFLDLNAEDSLTSIELKETSIGRHQQEMNDKTRSNVESIVRPILDEYGYE